MPRQTAFEANHPILGDGNDALDGLSHVKRDKRKPPKRKRKAPPSD
jgi:hypothetical protein